MKSGDATALKVLNEVLAILDSHMCPGPDEVDQIEKLIRKAIRSIEQRAPKS